MKWGWWGMGVGDEVGVVGDGGGGGKVCSGHLYTPTH